MVRTLIGSRYLRSAMYTSVLWQQIVLYLNIDQTIVNSLHRPLNYEIGGINCHIITTEYRNTSPL